MKVKILTWNIWVNESLNNIDNVIAEIKKFNPDIICLQEVAETEENRVVSKVLNSFNDGRFALADVVAGGRFQGNAILTSHKIVSSKEAFIADRSNANGDYSKEGRIYLECKIDIDGKVLTVGTTHSSYTHKFERTKEKDKEIERLLKLISENKQNYLFAGDLNTTHDNGYIKDIEKYLKNCGPDYLCKTWTTKPFSYNGFEETELNWRLDYIFASQDINALSSKILETEVSDHLPILTEIEI